MKLKEEEKVNETINESNNDAKKSEFNVEIKKETNKWPIFFIVIILLFLVLSTGFALANINNDKFVKGTKINNIDVSNLTKEKAISKIQSEINNKFDNEIILQNNEWNYKFKISDIRCSL